jgi:hypothetical protein
MECVFLLWYVHKFDDPDRDDDGLLIGVYRMEDGAKAAIERLSNPSGFVDRRDGFEIAPYELDKDHWTKGYIVNWQQHSST